MNSLKEPIKRLYLWVRWGEITEHVVDTIANVACEIEYRDRNGKTIGYWAYGHFDPGYPYRG